jgi:hypothetical protein
MSEPMPVRGYLVATTMAFYNSRRDSGLVAGRMVERRGAPPGSRPRNPGGAVMMSRYGLTAIWASANQTVPATS